MSKQKLNDIKQNLKRRGIVVSRLARDNNIKPDTLYKLLSGSLAGNYGDAHKAAVLLGLKEAV
jgi:gp16 family phage-associated protein